MSTTSLQLRNLATTAVAAVSFGAGAFLIFEGAGLNISSVSSYSCYGPGCPPYESIVFDSIGILLVYLSLPIALFGIEDNPTKWSRGIRWIIGTPETESTLLSNKRISGLSFIIAGSIQSICSFIGLYVVAAILPRTFEQPVGYTPPSIFSLDYLENWIFIYIGFILLAVGITLVLISRISKSTSPEIAFSTSSC
jgi:hypothetical protein